MVNGKKVVAVLPGYNVAKTLRQTYQEINLSLVDDIILGDNASEDDSVAIARELGIQHIVQQTTNKGYGGNQKAIYQKALEIGADIIIMVHPDFQYTPALIESMVTLIANNIYPVVLGSRMLGRGALKGGMPLYKYIANRLLTRFENTLLNQRLSEYHTGYRAYHRDVLLNIAFHENSNDFVFDNELLAQVFYRGYDIAEVTCPTKYFREASSINFRRSIVYGLGVLRVSLQYFLQKAGIRSYVIFQQPNTVSHITSVKEISRSEKAPVTP